MARSGYTGNGCTPNGGVCGGTSECCSFNCRQGICWDSKQRNPNQTRGYQPPDKGIVQPPQSGGKGKRYFEQGRDIGGRSGIRKRRPNIKVPSGPGPPDPFDPYNPYHNWDPEMNDTWTPSETDCYCASGCACCTETCWCPECDPDPPTDCYCASGCACCTETCWCPECDTGRTTGGGNFGGGNFEGQNDNNSDKILLSLPGYKFVSDGRGGAVMELDPGDDSVVGKVTCSGCAGGTCVRKGFAGQYWCEGTCDQCDMTIGRLALLSGEGSWDARKYEFAIPPEVDVRQTIDGIHIDDDNSLYGTTVACRCSTISGRCRSSISGGNYGCIFGEDCPTCTITVTKFTA